MDRDYASVTDNPKRVYNLINLRQYQTDIIDQTRNLMRKGVRSVLIQSPTGSGKTLLTAHMLKTAAQKGMSAFFIVHRRELVKQSIQAFAEVSLNHGVIANGWTEQRHLPIQIASIQTLVRRYKRFRKPSLVIYDECQHNSSSTWSRIYNEYGGAFHIGLTATPQRLDGQGLGRWFSAMVNGPAVPWLIDNKFLVPYKIYAPSNLDMSGVHTRMGDFDKKETASLVDKPTITGDVIKHYKKLCAGKRAVVFCVSIKHSQHVVEQFNKNGIKAVHVDGETKKEERDASIEEFRNGSIKVLSNVDLFGEGFDLPSLEVSILLRPTKSLSLYLQQVGRSLRPSHGKTHAYILDHAGNCERHGLPCDDREWSLEGSKGGKRGAVQEVKVRRCPKCFACLKLGGGVCVYCGWKFEVDSREVKQVDGDLVEIDPAVLRRKRMKEQGRADTLEDLVKIGRARGYKKPYGWASIIMRSRRAKRMAGK